MFRISGLFKLKNRVRGVPLSSPLLVLFILVFGVEYILLIFVLLLRRLWSNRYLSLKLRFSLSRHRRSGLDLGSSSFLALGLFFLLFYDSTDVTENIALLFVLRGSASVTLPTRLSEHSPVHAPGLGLVILRVLVVLRHTTW